MLNRWGVSAVHKEPSSEIIVGAGQYARGKAVARPYVLMLR